MATEDLTKQTTTTTTTTETPAAATPSGTALYNQQREQGIKDMYANNLANQKAQLQTAYNQNMSNAQAAYDKISPQYQQRQNELGAEYERQRRNNNMQAAANGLNTGAGSQMQLAQSNAYQSNQANLQKAENQALDEANRSMLDIKTDYQNRISEAVANNDYQMSAALLDEYNQAYQRNLNAAKQAADYGDFSLYVDIYGKEQADQMQKSWALQNPLLAYNLGKLTAQEYFNMTGSWPRGYTAPSSGGGGGGGYGGGAYYGPAGHYENGVWTLDSASPSSSSGGTNGGSNSSPRGKADFSAVSNVYKTAFGK